MSTAVQRRRGTTIEHLSFTGLEGEITVNTSKETIHVHDGVTAGGFEILRADAANYSGAEINNFRSQGIDDNVSNSTAQLILADGGILIGSPTGGVQGANSLNAESLFVNGSRTLTDSNETITGDWTFSGTISINGSLTVSSAANFTNETTFDSDVIFNSNVAFNGPVAEISATNSFVKDQQITLNDQEILNGVSGGAGSAGIAIDRGFASSAVATTGDLTFAEADPDTIKRTTGDWSSDGVIAGSFVSIQGSASNDGVYEVQSVSTADSTNDTIVLAVTEDLTPEGPVAVSTVTVLNSKNTVASLIFDETDDTWKLGLLGAEAAVATSASPASTLQVGDTSVTITDTGTDGTITFNTDGSTALTLANDQSATFTGAVAVNGNLVIGTGEIADAATDGFLYLTTTTSGAPTGVPTTYAGRSPVVIDDTNNQLYFYNGGWQTVSDPAAGLAYAIAFS